MSFTRNFPQPLTCGSGTLGVQTVCFVFVALPLLAGLSTQHCYLHIPTVEGTPVNIKGGFQISLLKELISGEVKC